MLTWKIIHHDMTEAEQNDDETTEEIHPQWFTNRKQAKVKKCFE